MQAGSLGRQPLKRSPTLGGYRMLLKTSKNMPQIYDTRRTPAFLRTATAGMRNHEINSRTAIRQGWTYRSGLDHVRALDHSRSSQHHL